ncbi:MAG: hypothetical protein USCAAHI_01431 [Beijerinckiaceae bacterium]|nr:MAG: hypothetical protein USCAAHI_01431 [Beijerinckiaceae bacterium]
MCGRLDKARFPFGDGHPAFSGHGRNFEGTQKRRSLRFPRGALATTPITPSKARPLPIKLIRRADIGSGSCSGLSSGIARSTSQRGAGAIDRSLAIV